eukprot:642938-Rhodomonas_salina.1
MEAGTGNVRGAAGVLAALLRRALEAANNSSSAAALRTRAVAARGAHLTSRAAHSGVAVAVACGKAAGAKGVAVAGAGAL